MLKFQISINIVTVCFAKYTNSYFLILSPVFLQMELLALDYKAAFLFLCTYTLTDESKTTFASKKWVYN